MYDIQKASILKRITAWILDIILLSILAVGFAWIISDISDFDAKSNRLDELRTQYATKHNITKIYTQQELDALTEEERLAYEAAVKAAEEDMAKDTELMQLYSFTISITLIMTSFSILLAVLALEFGIPMWLGNGQTIGKKVFGLAVIRPHGVKINGVCLFIRSILGKYTVEIMIPVLCLTMLVLGLTGMFAAVVIVLLLITQLALLIITPNNALIHDKMADTVVVDMASQMIFASEADRLSYIQRESAEKAARQTY